MTPKIAGYSVEELMRMDPAVLRAILHERTHHTIEVMIYAILNGRLKKPTDFGNQARRILDVWRKRGLPIDAPDLQWCIDYVKLADKLNKGEPVALDVKLAGSFSREEMQTVKKLFYERRSIRQFKNKRVPERMLREIMLAGLMAPQGCNICSTRFIVLRKPDEWRLARSDIPIKNGVMIVICQDMRLYRVLRFDEYVPQNIYYDAAAAADHMCLMAHALGLGACWLTHGEETQKALQKHFRLPEHIVSRCHIIVGWPDEAPIKSQRISLDEAILKKDGHAENGA
jgi:nitroreductase